MALSTYFKAIGLPDEPAEAYDKVSEILYSEYKKCVYVDGVGFEAPGYTCTPLVLANIGAELGNIVAYSYDTVIALCLSFNGYIEAISAGLRIDPTIAPQILPPASLFGISNVTLTAEVKAKTQASVNTTKPGTPPQDESIPLVSVFYGACGQFLYNIYLEA